MARPSKFTKEVQRRIELMARRGWTDAQMCELLKIDISTMTKWKQRKPEFFTSLREWKAEADHEVEKSLYERACGYKHPETKAQWVTSEVKGEDEEWHTVGRWEYADLQKQYPPDSTSMIFWLKNRQPKKWRDKQDVEHTGKDGGPIAITDFPPEIKTIEEWIAHKKSMEVK